MKVSQAAFESWHDAVAKGEVLTAPEVVFKEFVPDEIKAIDDSSTLAGKRFANSRT